ncbi:MAG: hypothetical protein EI684_11650, partial [Candidatus Viridilinea halotolerans]
MHAETESTTPEGLPVVAPYVQGSLNLYKKLGRLHGLVYHGGVTRRRDEETRRRGDAETRRRGDAEGCVLASSRPRVLASSRPRVL